MRQDDLQRWEIGRDVVDEHRVHVLKLRAGAARLARAAAHRPGVKQAHEAQLRGGGPQRVESLVVRRELLQAGMELQPSETERLTGPARFIDREPSLPRID